MDSRPLNLRQGEITGMEAIDRERNRSSFSCCAMPRKGPGLFYIGRPDTSPNTPLDLPMRVVIPAYILSDSRPGFAIGAVLFLPFLLIDWSPPPSPPRIGMFQLPPVVVSTPLKILLFVMVDGWNLLANSLLKSF